MEAKYKEEKLQLDEEIVIPQDDLYTIIWEVEFDYELFETKKDNWPDTATRLPNDAASGGVDYYVTGDKSSSIKVSEHSSEISNKNDITEKELMRNDSENSEIVPNGGADITVFKILHNEKI